MTRDSQCISGKSSSEVITNSSTRDLYKQNEFTRVSAARARRGAVPPPALPAFLKEGVPRTPRPQQSAPENQAEERARRSAAGATLGPSGEGTRGPAHCSPQNSLQPEFWGAAPADCYQKGFKNEGGGVAESRGEGAGPFSASETSSQRRDKNGCQSTTVFLDSSKIFPVMT